MDNNGSLSSTKETDGVGKLSEVKFEIWEELPQEQFKTNCSRGKGLWGKEAQV